MVGLGLDAVDSTCTCGSDRLSWWTRVGKPSLESRPGLEIVCTEALCISGGDRLDRLKGAGTLVRGSRSNAEVVHTKVIRTLGGDRSSRLKRVGTLCQRGRTGVKVVYEALSSRGYSCGLCSLVWLDMGKSGERYAEDRGKKTSVGIGTCTCVCSNGTCDFICLQTGYKGLKGRCDMELLPRTFGFE